MPAAVPPQGRQHPYALEDEPLFEAFCVEDTFGPVEIVPTFLGCGVHPGHQAVDVDRTCFFQHEGSDGRVVLMLVIA